MRGDTFVVHREYEPNSEACDNALLGLAIGRVESCLRELKQTALADDLNGVERALAALRYEVEK